MRGFAARQGNGPKSAVHFAGDKGLHAQLAVETRICAYTQEDALWHKCLPRKVLLCHAITGRNRR